MGVHKPWSPSRSYGLAVRLDEKMQPLFSLHSRADGTRHGVCSVLEDCGRLLVAARGGDCILDIDPADPARKAPEWKRRKRPPTTSSSGWKA